MQKKPLLILAGPTAVGKTDLSISLARAVNGAIISADSMQVYRGLDIGTGKIPPDETQGIPHYLIDVLEPDEEFHVLRFQQLAKKALDEIYDNGQMPIVVGGTGFYIQALLYDIDFTSQTNDPALRGKYEKIAATEGARTLHEMLRRVDPVSADAIHQNNVRRVIRALEFYEKSGRSISAHNERERKRKSPYDFCYFVLNDDRKNIYARIEKRVDDMLDAGLVDEVKALREKGFYRDMVSMQGLGYRQILAWLDGEIEFDEAICRIKQESRHFAKRQLTWFRRERDVIWVNKKDFGYDRGAILAYMLDCLFTAFAR